MNDAEGAGLSAQIEALAVPSGQLAVWALGQAGFALKGGDTIAYIDPYLSDSITAGGGPERRIPSPLDPATIAHADVVFATHAHADHVDVGTLVPLLAASPKAVLVTSVEGAEQATAGGIAADRIVTPALGVEATVGGLSYRAIPAAHYGFEVDAEGRSRFQGFLISCNGVTLYHAGDTILIPELLAALDGVAIDLALLPFNGRDFFREERSIVGNLLPNETVALAQRLKARVLIGMHNDLFSGNRVNPALLWDELERQAPAQRAHLLQPGELYLYAG
jgi:L-ascorbate metabolism protein UlaG (beta-lactamase superfamily)